MKKGSRIGYLYEVSAAVTERRTASRLHELLAATERGMFQDVWDTGVVWGIGLETDREDIVAVIAGNVQVFSARLVVA